MNTQPPPESNTPHPLDQLAEIIGAEAVRLGGGAAAQPEPPQLQSRAYPSAGPENDALRAYFTELSDLGTLAGHPDVSPEEQAALVADFRSALAPLRKAINQYLADNPPGPGPAPHERIAPSDNIHPAAVRRLYDE